MTDQSAIRDISLSLDVAQVHRTEQPFARLREVGSALAEAIDGVLCDQNGQPLPAMAMGRLPQTWSCCMTSLMCVICRPVQCWPGASWLKHPLPLSRFGVFLYREAHPSAGRPFCSGVPGAAFALAGNAPRVCRCRSQPMTENLDLFSAPAPKIKRKQLSIWKQKLLPCAPN